MSCMRPVCCSEHLCTPNNQGALAVICSLQDVWAALATL